MDRYYGKFSRKRMMKAEQELLHVQEYYERGEAPKFLKDQIRRTISSIRNQMAYVLVHMKDQ